MVATLKKWDPGSRDEVDEGEIRGASFRGGSFTHIYISRFFRGMKEVILGRILGRWSVVFAYPSLAGFCVADNESPESLLVFDPQSFNFIYSMDRSCSSYIILIKSLKISRVLAID